MPVLGYTTPGISVTETPSPVVAPIFSNPSILGIVGTATGKINTTEKLFLTHATTTSVGSQSLPLATINVTSTAGFAIAGSLYFGAANTEQVIAYTGKTATTFTGVTGGTGTLSAATVIHQHVPVTLAHTGLETASVVAKLFLQDITLNPGNYITRQSSDPDATVVGDEIYTFERNFLPLYAPNVIVGTGTLSGSYSYAISFVRSAQGVTAGGESGIGPASVAQTASASGFTLNTIPLGPTGTTARNVYRMRTDAQGDGKWHLVANIANNTAGQTVNNESMSDVTANAAAVAPSGIADGDTVAVNYNYTDNFYYEPTLLSDLDDIYEKYGAPFDVDGNISSSLSYGANIAFQNGASEVYCAAMSADTDSAVTTALTAFESTVDVRIIVPMRGSSGVAAIANAHATKMNNQGYYRQAVVGRDGSVTHVLPDTLRSSARGINAEATQYISPASFQIENPVTGRITTVGGQYVAAGVAGMWAARDVQFPLTKRALAGFIGLGSTERRTLTDLTLDSAAGLLVIEKMGDTLQVRHSVTTAVGDIKTQEGSVVRSKYEMAHRLRRGLDAYVGTITAPASAPTFIAGTVRTILDQLIVEAVILTYESLKARTLDSSPTTVEVRFSYTPTWPVNNINIIFNMNTTSGVLTIV